MTPGFPPLSVTPYWLDLNQHLIELLDATPPDRLDTSAGGSAWSIWENVIHIVQARDYWIEYAVRDGQETPDVRDPGQTREGLQALLRRSWARLAPFLSDESRLAATYAPPAYDDPTYLDPTPFDGYWIALYRFVHDVQHMSRRRTDAGEVDAGYWYAM